jgi:Arc/MetJ-type ribon-helix-helix transcriptional regulator
LNKRKGYTEKAGDYRKFCITLPEDLESFVDDLVRDVRKKKGFRLSKSEVIRAALKYMKSLDLNLESVKDENDLIERIEAAAEKVK